MHGMGMSWQPTSPQHKVSAGWLGDVTMRLRQSWEIFPDLAHSFPVNPPCEMPRSLNAWSGPQTGSIRADGNVQPMTGQQGHLCSTH